MKSVCSRSYHRDSRGIVVKLANNVLAEYYTHPLLFPAVVIPIATFTANIKTYVDTENAYTHGGINQHGAFLAAEIVLMADLDKIADDVDNAANGLQGTITDGGFPFTKDTHAKYPVPPQAVPFKLKTAPGKTIIAEIPVLVDHGTVDYFCICAEGADLKAGQLDIVNGVVEIDATVATNKIRISTANGRTKTFTNLIVNTDYFFYYYYVNAEGTGLLSKMQQIKTETT